MYSEKNRIFLIRFFCQREAIEPVYFDRFMTSDGIETLVLVTTETGQSVSRHKHRLIGFFCQEVVWISKSKFHTPDLKGTQYITKRIKMCACLSSCHLHLRCSASLFISHPMQGTFPECENKGAVISFNDIYNFKHAAFH